MINTVYPIQSEGLVLPKESITKHSLDKSLLCDGARQGTVNNVDGLDTRLHRWWIRHPVTQRLVGKSVFTRIQTNALVVSGVGVPNSGQDGRAKNVLNPQSDPTRSLSCALLSTYKINLVGIKQMIYTFLIAGGCQKLSDLKRIRTISVTAQSERLARKRLLGLPLVFVSQSPRMEAASC
jgi:hypothetical protein